MIQARYGVYSLEIFGSTLRGDAEPTSDVDLLVVFHQTPTFFNFIALENLLSEHLGLQVDLVMKESLKPEIAQQILGETLRV
ncbi:MAG: nucleotidyltransferase family protein [Anaerolineales bacterium]